VQTIYHAAAYKHVPMIELNNFSGIENNIFGTLSCAEAAVLSNVGTFVLISTDKAVRPTNIMGATKRFSEMILQALSQKYNDKVTNFSMVRFGNVLDSSGSVIPLFKKQIKEGGPVTVTDPAIIRYFMTIPEAAQLVIQAGAMSKGGDVFVLDMGEPVKILNLAKKMIHLSGLNIKDSNNPNGDIEILFTGLRPGEKLYEELLIGDSVLETEHQLILRSSEEMLPWSDLKLILNKLKTSVDKQNLEGARQALIEAVPGYKPQGDINDLMYLDS
jgi:FlaA1/EpsC-like NDP-sugar epimerase